MSRLHFIPTIYTAKNASYHWFSPVNQFIILFVSTGREPNTGRENAGTDHRGGNRGTFNSQTEISGGKMRRGRTRSSWQRFASQAERLGVPCK